MRLTLRTLLAWMDGVLPAAAAEELAAKVSATPLAQGLAERVRDVVARPTLPASAPEGRGFAADPNSTAEYLDNVLPADRLGDFERICIESDMQLAEVAACHHLLATLAREPAPAAPPEELRRRLLEVARNPAAALPSADGEPLAAGWPAAAGRPAGQAAGRDGGRASLAAWFSAIAAIVLLVALVGVLGWSIGRGGRKTAADGAATPTAAAPRVPAEAAVRNPPSLAVKQPLATNPEMPAAAPPAAVAQDVAPPVDKEAASPQVQSAPPGNPPVPGPPQQVATGAPPARGQDEPAPDQPAPQPAAAADQARRPMDGGGSVRVPQGEALAIAAPATISMEVPTEAPAKAPDGPDKAPVDSERPVPAAVPTQPAATGASGVDDKPRAAAVAVTTVGDDALLVRVAAAEGGRWESVRAGEPIALPADLLAPSVGRPALMVDRVRIMLQPQTRATLGRDADGTPRLEVVFGRAVIAGDRVNLRIGLSAGGLSGVAIGSPSERLGLEAELRRAAGADPLTTSAERLARLVTTGDGVEWLQTDAAGGPRSIPLSGLEPRARIPGGSAVEWHTGEPAAVALRPRGTAPAWLAFDQAVERTAQTAARAVSAGLPGGLDVQPALAGMAERDARVENRTAAIATLALLGDYDELVRTLCAEEKQPRSLRSGQWAELERRTIPLALARGATAATKLAESFTALAPPGTADVLVRMARGFGDDELAAGADADLVAALDSPHLVVRRYAIKNLLEITAADGNARLEYRADQSPGLRKKGTEWWRGQLEQGGIRRKPGAAVEAPPPAR